MYNPNQRPNAGYKTPNQKNNLKKWIIYGCIGVFALIFLFSMFYTVKSTERGVLTTFGKIHQTAVEDGLHVKLPFIQGVQNVNVQRKKFDGEEMVYTKDVQTSQVGYTITYDITKANVPSLVKNIGRDYHDRIVVPYIRGVMKDVIGNYAATNLVENREEARKEIEIALVSVLDSTYFYNVSFQITELDFDDAFEKAIKEKQVAEQEALKAKNVTIQVEEKAKQTKIAAEAEAEAMRIKARALESNPKLVNYEAVQKWNGQLPQYQMGNTVPFINIGN